ncbi:mechanosensitive ion channel family protein [Roseovarius sp. CH_XMU1461]|uniref:mechanosensitive ion channel family protein n=1 Tax=Roseovarius sp. CH_XMU1461 TaxID=3107777 RepID=UPI00300BA426
MEEDVKDIVEAVTPEELAQDAQEIALSLWQKGELLLQDMARTWNLYQLLIFAVILVTAHVLSRVLGPRLHDWMRAREGWPKWRMRFLVLLHRRLRLLLVVLITWPVIWIMREVTFSHRTAILEVAGKLALSWLVIAILTRLISNSFLRGTVRYVGWTWATLMILELTGQARQLLDSAALSFGDTRLSLWMVFQGLMIIGLLIVVARFISRTTSERIRQNEDISPSMQVLALKVMQITLYGAAFFIGLKAVGVDLTGLAVLSGAIGVGLGFGLQKVVSNLVSGVIILLDKSIKPGDVISLGETFGWINSLGARYVSVVTRDGREYLIPNEDLITGQVVNWSHSNDYVRLDIYFGTAYHDDPHAVRRIAIEAAKSVDRVLDWKPAVCHIVGFGDSSVDYILRFWISDPTGGLTNIRGNVYLALWDAFQEHGISIPFPQREVKLLNEQIAVAHEARHSADPAD